MTTRFSVGEQYALEDLRSQEIAAESSARSNVQDNDSQRVPGRYTVILTAAAVLFIGVGYTNTFGVFQEYYLEHTLRDEKPEKVIVIGSTAASLYLILGAFTGRFADMIGYRPSLLIGTALMVGSMFAASVSTTYLQLLFSQGIMFGLGVAFAYLPAVSISRQYWKQNHGVANAVVVSGGALGGTILPYIVRRLITQEGLPQTFRILGYIAAGGLAPSILFLRPAKPTTPLWRRRSAQGGRPPLLDLSLLHDARFNALLVASTIAMAGFLPRYFLTVDSAVTQGVDITYASWLLGLMNGLSIVGRVGIGWFADRFGKVTALTISFVLCGAGHLIFWLPGVLVSNTDKPAVTALFTSFVVFIGIFGSGFVSLFPVVVSHMFGAEALASKQGLLNTVVGLATLAGPSAIYAIVGNGETRHWAIGVITAGLFMLVGGMLLGALLSRPFKLVSRLGSSARVDGEGDSH